MVLYVVMVVFVCVARCGWRICGCTVEPVLCGLCHERPFVLNDRFHRHGLLLTDVCTMCYERPLRDRFCWAEGVVYQDRFYIIRPIVMLVFAVVD